MSSRKARDAPNVGCESERALGNGGPPFGSPLAGRDFTRSQRRFLQYGRPGQTPDNGY